MTINTRRRKVALALARLPSLADMRRLPHGNLRFCRDASRPLNCDPQLTPTNGRYRKHHPPSNPRYIEQMAAFQINATG